MWPNPQYPGDLVTFTEDILNGKLDFCAVILLTQDNGLLVNNYTQNLEWLATYSGKYFL